MERRVFLTRAEEIEWRKNVGYTTADEERFVRYLAGANWSAFIRYGNTLSLRRRWGCIDRVRIAQLVDHLRAAGQLKLAA